MVDIKTGLPQQEEIVLATVQGKDVTSMPEDLYVPPNSLKILLDTFSGPLDFLLYLIRKQKLIPSKLSTSITGHKKFHPRIWKCVKKQLIVA